MKENKVIKKIQKFVVEACENYDRENSLKTKKGKTINSVWDFHISSVVEHSMILAEVFLADFEVVKIAALLHDIASLVDFKKNKAEHHVIGAKMTEEILHTFGYNDAERIKKIKACILNHRASKPNAKTSIEETCVADGDALSHFYNVPSLIALAISEEKTVSEASEFVKNKLENSYAKMSERTKEMYKEKIDSVMEVFK